MLFPNRFFGGHRPPLRLPAVVSRCQRERRVAPITIWVAFSERAASRSASPTSAPATSW